MTARPQTGWTENHTAADVVLADLILGTRKSVSSEVGPTRVGERWIVPKTGARSR